MSVALKSDKFMLTLRVCVVNHSIYEFNHGIKNCFQPNKLFFQQVRLPKKLCQFP